MPNRTQQKRKGWNELTSEWYQMVEAAQPRQDVEEIIPTKLSKLELKNAVNSWSSGIGKMGGKYYKSYHPLVKPPGVPVVGNPELKSLLKQFDYIGGTSNNAVAKKVFDKAPDITHTIDSLSNVYKISPTLMKHRLAQEGYTDQLAYAYNNWSSLEEQQKPSHLDSLGLTNADVIDPFGSMGLDTVGEHLMKGHYDMKWTDTTKTWQDRRVTNELGQTQTSVHVDSPKTALEIKAAHLKYLQDMMNKRYPDRNEDDMNATINAAYNMGEYNKKLDDLEYVRRKYFVNWR